jgi:thiol-disulfide isomerase/thioredoxin
MLPQKSRRFRLSLLLSVVACASAGSPPPGTAGTEHGKLSELSRVEGEIVLCEHRVPEKVCTLHHPELVAQFQRSGDWCAPHGVPESQCLKCHPDLTFEPLPQLSNDADVLWLSKAGEDVPSLDAHAVVGKVTVFDFYAEWCAACRKVDGHVYRRLAAGDITLAYRKLNVVEWESPLAQRYVKSVPSLPFVVIYGVNGKLFKTLHGADLAALDQALAEAARR